MIYHDGISWKIMKTVSITISIYHDRSWCIRMCKIQLGEVANMYHLAAVDSGIGGRSPAETLRSSFQFKSNKANLVLSTCWKCLVNLPRKTLSIVYRETSLSVDGKGKYLFLHQGFPEANIYMHMDLASQQRFYQPLTEVYPVDAHLWHYFLIKIIFLY